MVGVISNFIGFLFTLVLSALTLAGPVIAIVWFIDLRRKDRSGSIAKLVGTLLFAYGWFAFFVPGPANQWSLAPSWEWPILFADGAVHDSRGRSFVKHHAAKRVQVYDADGNYLRGWYVEGGKGRLDLHVDAGDRLHVYLSRNKLLIFDVYGTLLEERTTTVQKPTTGPVSEIELSPPWWLLPLVNPLIAWLVCLTGGLSLKLHDVVWTRGVLKSDAAHEENPPES